MDPEQTANIPPAGAAAAADVQTSTSKQHSSKEPSTEPSSDMSSEHPPSEPPACEHPSSETPSEPPAKEHTYKFDVNMSCGGCSGAVTRALEKAQNNNAGISSFNVNLEKKEVIVKGAIAYEALYETIKKTGKTIRSGETVGN